MWIPLVERFGGRHHGYFLPHEGANNVAVALFSFPTLADDERYRAAAAEDAECQRAYEFAKRTRCIVSYERSFMRPVLAIPWEAEMLRELSGRQWQKILEIPDERIPQAFILRGTRNLKSQAAIYRQYLFDGSSPRESWPTTKSLPM